MEKKPMLYFITQSNLANISFGDSVNDNKLLQAIPKNYKIIKLFPGKTNNRLTSALLFLQILKSATGFRKSFLIRNPVFAVLPILLKKIFHHKIIIFMGSTPFSFLEKQAFQKNPEYNRNYSLITRVFQVIEPIYDRYVVKNADFLLVENPRVSSVCIKYGADPAKCILFPYYVEEYFLHGKQPSFRQDQKDLFCIGYSGRFYKYDLLPPVIEAIKLLKNEGYSVKLVLIGDGPTRKDAERLIEKLGLKDNVQFLGPQKHEVVAKLLDNFHCLVVPMVNYICPTTVAIKILEGALNGKIVITTKSGNNKAIFSPFYDLILDNTKPESIAEKIKKVMQDYSHFLKNAEMIKQNQIPIRSKSFQEAMLLKVLK